MDESTSRIVFHPTCDSCAQQAQVTLAECEHERVAMGIGWCCPHCARTNKLPIYARLVSVEKLRALEPS